MTGLLADLARHDFLRNALLAGLLTSVACGIVGSLVGWWFNQKPREKKEKEPEKKE